MWPFLFFKETLDPLRDVCIAWEEDHHREVLSSVYSEDGDFEADCSKRWMA